MKTCRSNWRRKCAEMGTTPTRSRTRASVANPIRRCGSRLGPTIVAVANENGHLMVEPKGQEKLEALPSSKQQFLIGQVKRVG